MCPHQMQTPLVRLILLLILDKREKVGTYFSLDLSLYYMILKFSECRLNEQDNVRAGFRGSYSFGFRRLKGEAREAILDYP